jgi:hypothetical protein
MKALSTILPAAIALAAMLGSATCASAADFGRAGGTVGADRIVKIGRTTVTTSLGNADFSKVYGNAGGPVGADAIAQVAQAPVTPVADVDFKQWYGRAGGPAGTAAASPAGAKVARAQ